MESTELKKIKSQVPESDGAELMNECLMYLLFSLVQMNWFFVVYVIRPKPKTNIINPDLLDFVCVTSFGNLHNLPKCIPLQGRDDLY